MYIMKKYHSCGNISVGNLSLQPAAKTFLSTY